MQPLGPENPLFIAAVVAAVGIILVIVWLVSIILRLLFDNEPAFPQWQPAYRLNALSNPDSIAGRRQMWQQQAHSDALPLAAEPGSFLSRKVLIGMDGRKLGGWQVNGMRVAQYDMYGRLARTQFVLGKGTYKPLNKVLSKPAATPAQIESAARTVSKNTVRRFHKKLKRTPTLPISLDLRFRGMRGEVHMLFELQQCAGSEWTLIDQWEPELAFAGDALQENYTYVLHGQRPGENAKALTKRLQADMARMLTAMMTMPPRIEPVPAPPAPFPVAPPMPATPATNPTPPVPLIIADDTAQMQAVLASTAAPPRGYPSPSAAETEDLPTVSDPENDLDSETTSGAPPDLPQ